MQYAQLKVDGGFLKKITDTGNIRWDENNYCTPQALIADGKAEQFRVVVLHETAAPSFDPITHGLREIDPALIGGQWTQQWDVYALSPEQVAANHAAATKALQNSIVAATQARLDDFAKTRNYDGIVSLCTYAASTVLKFKTEGQYGVDARDSTWARIYEIMAEVEAGARPVPSGFADIEPDLPVLAWPA